MTQVTQMPYPLKIKPQGKYKYFQQREEWKVTDILMNPMVMMMLLPLLLVTVLPKMMQVLFRPSTYCFLTWAADPVELGRDSDPDPASKNIPNLYPTFVNVCDPTNMVPRYILSSCITCIFIYGMVYAI
jgi:hypothetical protein